jgi:hypothetical protein
MLRWQTRAPASKAEGVWRLQGGLLVTIDTDSTLETSQMMSDELAKLHVIASTSAQCRCFSRNTMPQKA